MGFRRSKAGSQKLSTSERRPDGASHPKVAGALLMIAVVVFLVLVSLAQVL